MYKISCICIAIENKNHPSPGNTKTTWKKNSKEIQVMLVNFTTKPCHYISPRIRYKLLQRRMWKLIITNKACFKSIMLSLQILKPFICHWGDQAHKRMLLWSWHQSLLARKKCLVQPCKVVKNTSKSKKILF